MVELLAFDIEVKRFGNSAHLILPKEMVGERVDVVRRGLDVIEAAAQAAFRPAKPLDNTDLTLGYRKQMSRVYVARALKELAGLPAEEPPTHVQ